MVDPAAGPFLFDTSAESWLARQRDAETIVWLRVYLSLYQVNVSLKRRAWRTSQTWDGSGR